MPTEAQTKAMRLYGGIMEEVNIRTTCINVALAGRTMLPERAVIEFCFLQIRMLCELIALGCLAVHGDINEPEIRAAEKQWHPDKILTALEALHPDFYPHPVKRTMVNAGHIHLDEIQSGYLTKAELLKLFGYSGDVLHRGSLKNILVPNRGMKEGLRGIADWGNKITKLLGDHRIGSLDNKTHFLCALNVGGSVQVALAGEPLPGNGQGKTG